MRNPTETDPLLSAPLTKSAALHIDDSTYFEDSPQSEAYGYTLLLLSTLCFSLMSLCSRSATAYHGLPPAALVFARGAVQFSVLLAIIFGFTDYKHTLKLSPRLLFALSIRGAFGGVAMALGTKAYSLAPLSAITSVMYLYPITTMLLSALVLGERINKRLAGAAAISFFGVGLVTNPTLSLQARTKEETLGICLAVLCALCISVSIVSIRYMRTDVHFLVTMLVFAAAVIVVGAMLGGASVSAFTENPTAALIMLATCVFGFLGQACVTKGYQHCRAGSGSLLRNIGVPFSYMFGMIVLHEQPELVSIVGSALVVFGALVVGIENLYR
eukprot:IDg2442t1